MPEEKSNGAIKIWVPGIPQPGGSKKGFAVPDTRSEKIALPDRPGKFVFTRYRAVLTEDNRKSKPWRESVAWAAKEVIGMPIEGPIEISFKFFMPRPKSHYGRRGLRQAAPALPTVKPDVTKLIRSTEDAMKGIAWIDDSQVIDQHGRKVYGTRPGALITIRRAIADVDEETAADEEIVRQMGMRFL